MKKIKVIYVISDIDKAISFEWLAERFKEKYDLRFILIGKENSKLAAWLKAKSIKTYEITDKQFKGKVSKWLRIVTILRDEKPEIVHTHLWIANLLGLSASWLIGIKKRVYTRHHATIHYVEFPSGRKWDLLCNFLATDIVAISKNIEVILIDKDKANPQKVKLIHHGFDFAYFKSVNKERVDALRIKYDLNQNDYPIIGVISRYMKWKGIQFTIEAFKLVQNHYPNAKLILANAHGDYGSFIQNELRLWPANSYREIIFEDDLAALYKLFDVFVHVPYDPFCEAFGQTYIEALISEIPSVFTLSGVASEFIRHKTNAWVANFKNSNEIAEGICKILTTNELREQFKIEGARSVRKFSIENHVLALDALYRS